MGKFISFNHLYLCSPKYIEPGEHGQELFHQKTSTCQNVRIRQNNKIENFKVSQGETNPLKKSKNDKKYIYKEKR